MSDIKEALGDDMQVVTHAMGLDALLSLDMKNTQRSSIGGKEAANRLQYAVRRLMRAICSNLEAGVTVFIDDLQWADLASLELLQSLMEPCYTRVRKEVMYCRSKASMVISFKT